MSKYVRKTTDEYRIWVKYGQGWEHDTTELTLKLVLEQMKCYRADCKFPVKWTGPHRVKKDE